jgi:WD40 repeat protein
MSRSDDPGHYFQTTAALNEETRRAAKASNTKGSPIKLPSKILAVIPDPRDHDAVYVAEAAGNIKRVNVKDGRVCATFSGPAAPLTSLALSPNADTLYAGCWDKSVWSWNCASRKPGKRFQGHSDFVKAVVACTLQGKELLISASADATIIVWDAASGEKLHTLKGHTRGILALALDRTEHQANAESVTLMSAGTDREIRTWTIALSSASEVQPSPIIAHETSIDAIHFDSDGDLWTASADKSGKCLSRSRQWEEDSTFEHPDFVRDVAIDEEGGWALTACRDEQVRVWNKASGKLHHIFSGHFEEVTGLVLLPGQRVVSVSIDGTIRTWDLQPQELAKAVKEVEDEKLGVVEEKKLDETESGMTAEEEAELAELLDDDE